MDYNNLDWGWAGSLVDKTPSQGDVSSTYKSVLQSLQATQQNADLLKALGFSGQALSQAQLDPNMDYGTNSLFNGSGEFTPEALNWLDSSGYSLGVGHEPGTKAGGRSEYWGLLDPSGQYLAGQTDPLVSQSSSNPWAEWAMMALPLVTMGTSAAMSGVGEGLTGSALEAGGSFVAPEVSAGELGTGTLGAEGATSLEQLAASPIQKFGEPAALNFAPAPSLQPSLQEVMTKGALKGGVTGGIKGLITGQNPLKTAVKGALTGGVGGGIGYGVNELNPGGTGMINNGITGAATTAAGGGNPIIGALTGMMKSDLNTGNSLLDSGIGQGILGGLAGLYLGNKAGGDISSQLSSLQGLYSPGSPYETILRKQLERRDAAAGRRSQYGPREVELQAALAAQASKVAPLSMTLSNQRTANRNLMASNLLMNPAIGKLVGKGIDGLAGLFSSPTEVDPFTAIDDGGWV